MESQVGIQVGIQDQQVILAPCRLAEIQLWIQTVLQMLVPVERHLGIPQVAIQVAIQGQVQAPAPFRRAPFRPWSGRPHPCSRPDRRPPSCSWPP